MRISPAKESEYAGIYRLYAQFDEDRVKSGVGTAGYKVLAGESPWASTLRDPDCETFVVHGGGEVMAFITVRRSHANPFKKVYRLGEVDLIVVDRRLRRRGIGRWLFQYAAKAMKNKGFSHLMLNVHAKNIPAIIFWAKEGFKPLSKTEYVRGDGVKEETSYMIKKI